MAEIHRLDVTAAVGAPEATPAELLAVGVWKGKGAAFPAEASGLDGRAGGRLAEAIAAHDFEGEANGTLFVTMPAGSPWKRILLVGLGPRNEATLETVRQAAGTAARAAQEAGVRRGASLLLGDVPPEAGYGEWVEAQAEAAVLSTYQFLDFRTKDTDKIKRLESWTLIETDKSRANGLVKAVERGRTIARGTNTTRWLGGLPGNHATPSFLAAQARGIAEANGFGCTVMEPKALEEMGMGALLSVARGSEEPCRFIVLEAKVSESAPWVAFVGKGITFDSGGISIKPAANMWDMKYDMCGAGAVLGLFSCLKAVAPKVNVVGAIPTTENLPGGRATKPGDIVTSYSGKTIEILNTDAEGRLVLADALTYVARTYKPAAIVDLATLTGACVIALGHYAAGLMSNDEALASRLEAAGRRSGEKVWRLPLWDDYKEHLKSSFADIKNITDASAGAGTITAACFLSEFVEGRPWAHLDIAGTAWWEKDRPYTPKGPSGFGVRLLADLLTHWEG